MGHHELPTVKGCNGLARSDKGTNFLPVSQVSIRQISSLSLLRTDSIFPEKSGTKVVRMFSMKTKFYFKLPVLQYQNGISPKQERASMEILGGFLVIYITATKSVFSDSAVTEHSDLLSFQFG